MKPLRVRFLASPRAYRGRLKSGSGPGTPVHAGTFLRKREIVLDTALLASPGELLRILTHEMYHFVWLRLGNPARASYERLLAAEIRRGARGELGLVFGGAKAAPHAARPAGADAPLARVRLREFLRYRRVAVQRHPASRRVHAGALRPAAPAGLVPSRRGAEANLSIIGGRRSLWQSTSATPPWQLS